MRFTAVIIGALATLAVAQTTTSAPENTQTAPDSAQISAYKEALKCIEKCDAADVACQAECQGLPNPSEDQVNATTECVAACPKGDGRDVEADTKKWNDCKEKCIQDNYLSTPAGGAAKPTPPPASKTNASGDAKATGGSDSGSGSGSKGGSNSNSDSSTTGGSGSGSGSDSSDASGTGTADNASPTGGAGAMRVGGAALGAVGLAAAVLAL